MRQKLLSVVLDEAHQHACALKQERLDRSNGRHYNDSRIATEVAARLFELGNRARDLLEENERMRKAIDTNLRNIQEIRNASERLQEEMDVATNQDLVHNVV